ncbi:sporulation-delaying protein SdpB family protein [Streptomyces sp. NRRL S-1448]|uniref:sporulation-delaying protein SdpB family protein n=1 Tax=Streptomyces sp. NRRL S-1448 TaxID=1463883 RepID=UPI00099B6CC6|nr:sporulation-delaying protein SdpB family protein [Streptomyces sp. NRRL S-1448]
MLTHRIPVPWTNVYGLARTLIALGTAATLALSSTATLFRPVATLGDYPTCKGISSAGAFCLVPEDHIGWVQWLCVSFLILTASGWRPQLTALPHAYINFSVFTGIAIGDGGDQLAANLSLLLVLTALGDRRKWHWDVAAEAPATSSTTRVWALIGVTSLAVVRLQMCFVYFQASIAKLPHAEWADGSAMYYWMNDSAFGAPGWLRPLVEPLVSNPMGVAILTWVPLAIEISLAAALLLPQQIRWILLAAGVTFHLSIALIMGLWSFALSMWGGLVLLCMPLGGTIRRRYSPNRKLEESGEPSDKQDRTSSTVSSEDNPISLAKTVS